MKFLFVSIVVVFLLMSCDSNESFYIDSYKDDLSRIPLIKPYELINPFKEALNQDKAWNLNFKRDYTTKQNLKDNICKCYPYQY